jgi:DNA-binding beta-propeller fold protein YncE
VRVGGERLAQRRYRFPLIGCGLLPSVERLTDLAAVESAEVLKGGACKEIDRYCWKLPNKETKLNTIVRYYARWVPFLAVLIAICASAATDAPQMMAGHANLMYVGTLDHKLLIIDQDKEEVVGEIPLTGIARGTALSADQKELYLITTTMNIEIVDLEARKVVGTIDLTQPGTKARVMATARNWLSYGSNGRFSGLAVDPTGHYLYTTLRVVT